MSSRVKSRAATIVELFFDGLLLLIFIAQAFLLGCLLTYGHLPLPTKWVSDRIREDLPDGISISADSYALNLDGTIRMENVQFQLNDIEQAFFKAEYAHIEFGVTWDREKPLYLKGCILSNGLLSLPAVYSPSGTSSTVLDHIALRLLPTELGVRVDSFAALHEDIRLRGSINWMISDSEAEPENFRKKADQFFKQVANVMKHKSRFDGLDQPTILFQLDTENDGSLNVFSRISSRAYNHDRLQAENLTMDATFSLADEALVRKSSILVKADGVELPAYNTRASYVSAKVNREEWEALLKGEWPGMELVAETLDIEDVHLESPRIKLHSRDFPVVAFEGFTSGLRGAVEFSGSANVRTRAASLQAAGSIDLFSILPEKITERLPAITVNQAPYCNLILDFNEDFALHEAELRARVDGLVVKGLNFDHILFRSSYAENIYSIDQLHLRRDWQWLNLGFRLDNSTADYALTLKGFTKPYDYNAILPGWWGKIFEEFDFEQVESGLGDFVIYGNTKEEAASFFFGHASARNVAYKNVTVDEGELIVRGRGPYAEIHQLNVRSGGGFVRGDIGFASRLDEVSGPMSVRLDLDTKLPLSDAKKLFDEKISVILSDFETEALPRTILKGAIFNNAYPEYEGRSHIDVVVTCSSPISYKGMLLDYLNFKLFGREDITYLRGIRFGYAGGEANADADILTAGGGPTQTRFQVSVEAANQEQAISQLTKLRGEEQSEPEPESEDTAGEGLLDFNLHAKGPFDDPYKMNGIGSFQIENDDLYAIQLFGPLSKLLQNRRLGFSSFALNEMQASFTLNEGAVKFEQLEINGPRTRIEAPGRLKLDDFSLAMRVSVYLFGNTGNPDSQIRKISELITKPIPNLLEFELTGTPENQNWRSLYDPRKFIPQF